MMQILLGALLFSLATAALAYFPGTLLLFLLKRSLSPAENITLSCIIGLVISACVYWLFAFFHLFHVYFLWPLLAAAAFAYCLWRHRNIRQHHFEEVRSSHDPVAKPPCDRSWLALAAVIALGIIVLAMLPQYYANLTWRKDGTMKVYPVDDVFLHLAVANELTHTVPPEIPVFAGRRLTYHYGMDLSVAMFAAVTGINTRDLTLRFMPTLFLTLAMLCVFCFSRTWFGSGYFASLVVFLVFFGEDFSFIPGLLQGESADWSVFYFQEPAVFSLFYNNPMLPALGLLFAGLFCLQSYLRDKDNAWLFLSALLFTALLEVKVFTAAQLMISLGMASVVYVFLIRDYHLFKVAALTAILSAPLILAVFFGNKSGGDIIMSFDPWAYVSLAMKRLDLETLETYWLSFVLIAVPIYLLGCFGLRFIGVSRIFRFIVFPKRELDLSCVLAFFVLIGVAITMTVRIIPAGFARAFNNGGWFLVQSKYIAWIFTVAVFQDYYHQLVAKSRRPMLMSVLITLVATGLSAPSTVYHFAFECGKSANPESQTYSREIIRVMEFLSNDSRPGDVVLPGGDLLGPICSLTRCRVPLGYFSSAQVPSQDYKARVLMQAKFWKNWAAGKVQSEFLRTVGIRYIVIHKQLEGIPKSLPWFVSQVFVASDFVVFKVNDQNGFEQR